MELLKHLQQRSKDDNPIQVGIVGCGKMGSGMIHVAHKMPGFHINIIADKNINLPRKVLDALGIPKDQICITSKANEAEDALRKGFYVITEDALLLSNLENIDAVIEATGDTEVGSQVAWNCIQNNTHIVMLNVETDITVGFYLHHMANCAGCVYTVSSGDEPGACKQLYDFARSLGFEVVCLGKGKNNPLRHNATPDSCLQEANTKNMNPKMLAAFQDGTKTMVEMASVSNATGLLPDLPGMHGKEVNLKDLSKVLIPKNDGGILENRGCVEYSVGDIAPGVFAIITTDDQHIRDDLKFLSMGEGPYYTLYRPYHLCNIEAPLSIAEAIIYRESTLYPKAIFSEVIAVAKRDIQAGETIGDIGCADFYGKIYSHEKNKSLHGVPIGLVPGGTMKEKVRKGEMFTMKNFAPDSSKFIYKLFQKQEALISSG